MPRARKPSPSLGRLGKYLLPPVLGLPILVVAAAVMAPLPERLAVPGSPVVHYRDGTTAHVFLAPDDRVRIPVTVEEVDSDYIEALVRFEDKRFWWHPGIDPLAMLRAITVNLRAGRVETGASTLTMQLVRVLEPRPRTLRSKLIECFRALTLELRLTKTEILAAYLTFAPYGGNLEGVESASLAFFGHRADALSIAEIGTLLAVPQNPNRRRPGPENHDRLKAGRDDVLSFLADHTTLRDSTAFDTPVPARTRPVPREAIHAAGWLMGQDAQQTTLDRGTQRLVETLVARIEPERRRQGIFNTSVVVVDHEAAEIRALVGNFDFWDADHGGQFASFAIPRSPGSALKPFIYALLIEEGKALPEHLVLDVPRSYGNWSPTNYDGGFTGLVRFEDALASSLNLPFVFGLETLGTEQFIGHLQTLGVRTLSPQPGHYGLSVAAGGIELSALELTGLYTTLARGGDYLPLTAVPAQRSGFRAWSEGASWLTARALRLKDRPDFPTRWEVAGISRGIAWKTGTSFGHRDAWACGWQGQHTACVWMGNLDQTPSSHLVGSDSSGTVLFDLLEALHTEESRREPVPPPTALIPVDVCAYSGHLPSPACPETQSVLARTRAVPTTRCPYHVSVDVDTLTGLAVAPGCRGENPYQTRTAITWPASVRRWLSDQHRALPERPAWTPACRPTGTHTSPRIVHPTADQVAILVPGIPAAKQEIPLQVDATRGDITVSWFVDGHYLGTALASERVWWLPSVGTHEVVLIDETGAQDAVTFEVRTR